MRCSLMKRTTSKISTRPSMTNVPGVPKGDAKCATLRIKTWDILTRGGKVVFATDTDTPNSVGEAFIMQTYLAEALLASAGSPFSHAWARTFAEVVPVFEMTPDGGGFRVTAGWPAREYGPSYSTCGSNSPLAAAGSNWPAHASPDGRQAHWGQCSSEPALDRLVKICVGAVEEIKGGFVDRPTSIICSKWSPMLARLPWIPASSWAWRPVWSTRRNSLARPTRLRNER